MEFKPRLTRPEAGNKYYITKANGGYSDAIKGKPTDSACDVLHNCVGYAYGRFNEIGGHGYCRYLRPVNAEMFIEHCGGLKVGQTPKLGACMVWKKGATLSGSDGAGHVAIVEQIYSDTVIVTSESGYGSASPFWIQRRSKGDGNWGAGSGYTFLGFIYQPVDVNEKPVVESKKPVDGNLTEFVKEVQSVTGSKVDGIAGDETIGNTVTLSRWINRKHPAVRIVQNRLIELGYGVGIYGADGVFGAATASAVKEYQRANGCVADGVITARKKTWRKLLGME